MPFWALVAFFVVALLIIVCRGCTLKGSQVYPAPEIHSLDAEHAKTLLEAVRREHLEAVFVVAVSAGLLIG